MAAFNIRIAGHVFRVLSLFESTRDYCRAYLSEEEPEFTVSVSREDLSFEQEFLRQEAIEEGIRIRVFPNPFLERAAIQRKVAEALFSKNILLFHGSGISVDGQGYLFTAKCGTGKSTHTRLWRQTFGSRAVMVNDDKPFLELTDAGVLMHGAPWSGKHGLDTNITVPLKGLCILERGAENRIEKITSEAALPMLEKQGCPPLTAAHLSAYPAQIAALSARVTLWRMFCTKDPEAAEVSHAAMSESC